MGQKTSPTGFRIGIMENWRSRWISDKKDFGRLLVEDQRIRKHVQAGYATAGIPKVEIERLGEEVKVIIHAARPGLLIGRKGARVDKLREDLESLVKRKVILEVKEIQTPELCAKVVAEGIADQLKRRQSFRRVLKNAIRGVRDAGALGVKVQVAGRLGGAELARTEASQEGKIPLQTLRAKIDFDTATAMTTFGTIGVKVWIFTGFYEEKKEAEDAPAQKS